MSLFSSTRSMCLKSADVQCLAGSPEQLELVQAKLTLLDGYL